MSAEAGYEIFAVGAAAGVRAWGPRVEDAFAQAALGVLSRVANPGEVTPREPRDVRAQADSEEALLVAWISECLYVHEIEGFVVNRAEVDLLAAGVVHGFLHGEELDRARHGPGTEVKAATLHGARIVRTPGRIEVSIVIDV